MIDDKLLIVGRSFTRGASRFLRMDQHLDVLNRKGLATCVSLGTRDDAELAWKAKCLADVFVSNGTPSDDIVELHSEWREGGKPWIWDFDDDPANTSPFNPAYRVFGLEEVEFEEAVNGRKHFWKDGYDGFDLEMNRKRHLGLIEVLRTSSAMSTTTPYLAERLKALAPDTPILIRPNTLDFQEVWKWRSKKAKDGKIRILYQGGSSHYADLFHVLPALKEIQDRYPHVLFLFFGDTKAYAAKVLSESRIEHFEWSGDYPTFVYQIAKVGPDIGIAPLLMDDLHGEFNRCKSCLKWVDYSALGIPTVAQNDTPYREAIRFGKEYPDHSWTGLLAGDLDEWLYSLSILIENFDMRQMIGENAYAEVREYYDAESHATKILREYEEVAVGHNDLACTAH